MPAMQNRCLARLAAVLLLSSGCSVMMSHAPIRYEPNQGPPGCMRAPVGPMLDLAATPVVFLAGALVNALEDIGRYCDDVDGVCDPRASEGDKLYLAAAFLAASSVYGLVQTGRCHDAHARYREYRAAGAVTLTPEPEPEPESSVCRVWQRRYRAATTVDEKRAVMSKAAPECRPLLDLAPTSR